MESSNRKRTTTTIIILIATALLIGGVVIVAQQNNSKNNSSNTSTQSKPAKSPSDEKSTVPGSSVGFKDGSYSATGTYQSPGGGQEIKLKITLVGGNIIDTSAEGDNKSSDSRFYQSSFISGYREKIVGKKVDEVKLDHVGSSSLTSGGFNDAMEDIKNQAKA